MLRPITILFVLLSAAFALTHFFATQVSLYWHFKGFDSVMHLWGGGLIALGIHSLSTFRRIRFVPTLHIIIPVAIAVVVAWEVFEWVYDIHNNTAYVFDTTKDIVLGIGAAVLVHYFLKRRRSHG